MIELLECEMQHDRDTNGVIEKSTKKALLLDNDEIITSLGFKDKNAFRKVDYVKIKDDKVYLIEFTDLSNEIRDCIDTSTLLNTNSQNIATLIKTINPDLKLLKKKLWLEVIEEFKGKFISSIACYERLLRLNNQNHEFQYSLMIVLKNNTDPKYFEFLNKELQSRLINLTGEIKILRTQDL